MHSQCASRKLNVYYAGEKLRTLLRQEPQIGNEINFVENEMSFCMSENSLFFKLLRREQYDYHFVNHKNRKKRKRNCHMFGEPIVYCELTWGGGGVYAARDCDLPLGLGRRRFLLPVFCDDCSSICIFSRTTL